MRGLRRTEKFETDKPSNRNLKRKQRGAAELETGGRKLRSACDTKQKSGERKSQEAEYQNRKGRMETGETEEERSGTKEADKHRRNRCQGKTGRREKKEQKAE